MRPSLLGNYFLFLILQDDLLSSEYDKSKDIANLLNISTV